MVLCVEAQEFVLPDDADAAGPRTTFWELLLWRNDKSQMLKVGSAPRGTPSPLPALQFPSVQWGYSVHQEAVGARI